jgi:ABC-2 type transport system permease protein
MMTIFRYALARFRGQIIAWGLVLFLFSLMTVARYKLILENQAMIEQMVKGSSGQLMKMFGDTSRLTTPEGFLSLALFNFLPLIVGVFAVLAGSGLLASDEESGTLDLILAYPLSRSALFAGRLLAFGVATLAILALSWLGFIAALSASPLAVGWAALVLPHLALASVLFFFGGLALLLSMILPSRRSAAMTAGMALVASFFLTTLARLDPGLETVARLSPLHYYQSGDAINGLDGQSFGGLLAAAGLFVALAWWRFERRDIRVAGEGGWRWSLKRPRAVR